MAAQLALLALFVASALGDNGFHKVRVCYYNGVPQVQDPTIITRPADIDPNACTHVVYCFAQVDSNGNIVIMKDQRQQSQDFTFIQKLKQENRNLKVLLGVAAYTPDLLVQINNVTAMRLKKFIVDNRFDGVDIFLHSFGSDLDSRMIRLFPRALRMCKYMKAILNPYLVTVTLQPVTFFALNTHILERDLPDTLTYVDMMHMATYDLFLRDRSKLTHHTSVTIIREVLVRVRGILQRQGKVALMRKITLGLATYARSLVPESSPVMGSPVKRDRFGRFMNSRIIPHNVLCSKLPTMRIVKDQSSMAPYAFNKDLWASFDDNESMAVKLDIAKRWHLLGVNIWSLDLDSMTAKCHYPPNFPVQKRLMTIQAIVAMLTRDNTRPTSRPEPNVGDFLARRPTNLVRVCYYNRLARNFQGIGKFTPEMINPYLCTHIIYAFPKIDTTKLQVILTPEDQMNLRALILLKKKNPHLKILITIGEDLKPHLENPTSLKAIAKSLVKLVKEFTLDGIDIFTKAMQFFKGNSPRRLINGVELLCNEIRKEVRVIFVKPGEFILTVTFHGMEKLVTYAEDLKRMLPILNWINVAMYDLMSGVEDKVGHQAPLNMIKSVVETLIQRGIAVEKLVLGLSAYARTWTLSDPKNFKVGAPARGRGEKGHLTNLPGHLATYELCKKPYTFYKDSEAMVPYGHHGNQWFSFETLESMMTKVEYALMKTLRGVMVWSLGATDHHNICKGGPHPFLHYIKTRFESFHSKKKVLKEHIISHTTHHLPRRILVCHSTGLYQSVPFSNWWCTRFCRLQWCSSWFCKCYYKVLRN